MALKVLELPFYKGISWFYMFNVLKNITNPSGLNHVCMILVALFSFQRTPHSSFLSVALLLLVKFLDVPFMYAFVALLRRASLQPKITSCSNLHESILSCFATNSLRELLFSGNINQYPNAFPEAFAS